MTTEERIAFIQDPKQRQLTYTDDKRITMLIKIAYNESIDFLYLQYHFSADNPLQIGEKMEYVGFVHYPTGRLFDTSYNLFHFDDTFKGITLEELRKECEGAINAELVKRVDNKPVQVTELAEDERFDREYFEKYGISEKSRRAFFDAEDKVTFRSQLTLSPNTEDYIQMVMDMGMYVKVWVDTYIMRKAKSINERLWELSQVQKALDVLHNTPGLHHTTREIAYSTTMDMKMVNLHIDKDGKQMIAKYPASFLRMADTYDYSTYHMDAPSERKFDEMYGRSAKLNPQDIQSITYGKKVLYSREE